MKRLSVGILFVLMTAFMPPCLFAQDLVSRLRDPSTPKNEYPGIIEQIAKQGKQIAPELAAFLKEPNKARSDSEQKQEMGAKQIAMDMLAEMKAEEGLDPLKDMIDGSDDLSLIYNSARAAGRIGGNKSSAVLKQILNNADKKRSTDSRSNHRKLAAVLGLGLCGDKETIPLLKQEFQNEQNDDKTRIYAAGSLGLMGVADGLGFVTAKVRSDDPDVKLAAIRVLGAIASPSSLNVLNEVIKTEKYVYQESARASIAQIEAMQLSGDAQVSYIRQKLSDNSGNIEFVIWGTGKLKGMNTESSRNALKALGESALPEMAFVSHIARIKLSTM